MRNKVVKAIVSIVMIICITVSSLVICLNTFAADDYEAFLYKMGSYESGNDYTVKNSYGYLGRWQIGTESLKDIGFMYSSGKWSELANSFGVYSESDFLHTPAAQDYAIRLYDKRLWSYVRYLGDDRYIGTVFDGIPVTLSGIIAAAHLVGAYGVHRMFTTGRAETDVLGNKCTFYLKNLAGYDISEFLGADLSAYVSKNFQGSVANRIRSSYLNVSKINLYANTSGCNYLLGTDFSEKLDTSNITTRDKSVYTVALDKANKYGSYNSLRIKGKKAGASGKDVCISTDLNGNTRNDNYIGDHKPLTFSFYAKGTVNGAKMYWRWGYGKAYKPIVLTTDWKQYTVTVTKINTDGSKLYLYFDKAGEYYLNQLMMVDGNNAPSLFTPESSGCIKTFDAPIGGTYGSLPTPRRGGYKFLGWYTSKVGGTKLDSSTGVYEQSVNAYAHWERIASYVPENTMVFGGHYYTLYNDEISWQAAKTACEKMGGHLVTIESAEENAAVTSLASNGIKCLYWIGASSDGKGNWKWVNGKPIKYNAWNEGEPSNGKEKYAHIFGKINKDDDCVGKWNDIEEIKGELKFYSLKNIGYICEFEPESFKPTVTKKYKTSTYQVFDRQISWPNARYLCESTGAELVSIGSADENKFVSNLVKSGKSKGYWIGASNRLADKDKYAWTTGQKFSFTNWKAGEPTSKSSSSGHEHYVQIEKSSLKWIDCKSIGVSDQLTGFIMENDTSLSTVRKISIVKMPSKMSYNAGETVNTLGIKVMAQMSDGTKKELEYGFTCEPAKVSGSGTQQIKLKYANVSTTFDVYVYSSKDAVRVKGCKFEKEELKVKAGKTVSQSVVIDPIKAECRKVTWYSSDESVATVDQNGVVTGIKKGTATISAVTFDGNYTAEYTITVKRTAWQWTKYYVFFGWLFDEE